MSLTIYQAVDLLYRGRSNVIKASQACGAPVDTLKQLLLEKINSKPHFEPLQLTLPIK